MDKHYSINRYCELCGTLIADGEWEYRSDPGIYLHITPCTLLYDERERICAYDAAQAIPRAKLLALVAELEADEDHADKTVDKNVLKKDTLNIQFYLGVSIGLNQARHKLRTLLDETEGNHADDHLP